MPEAIQTETRHVLYSMYSPWMAISHHSHWKMVASSSSRLLLPAGLHPMVKRSWKLFLVSLFPAFVNTGRNCFQHLFTICQNRPHESIPATNCWIMLATLLTTDCTLNSYNIAKLWNKKKKKFCQFKHHLNCNTDINSADWWFV